MTGAADTREFTHPDFVVEDDGGRALYRYLAAFRFCGEERELEIWARDRADAQRQLTAIRSTITLVGQVKVVVE